MDNMVYKVRVMVLDKAGVFPGHYDLKLPVLFYFVDDPADQLGGDHRTGDYVSFVNADRAVFRDIGDLILHRLKKIYFIIILASAGSDEHNAFFRSLRTRSRARGVSSWAPF